MVAVVEDDNIQLVTPVLQGGPGGSGGGAGRQGTTNVGSGRNINHHIHHLRVPDGLEVVDQHAMVAVVVPGGVGGNEIQIIWWSWWCWFIQVTIKCKRWQDISPLFYNGPTLGGSPGWLVVVVVVEASYSPSGGGGSPPVGDYAGAGRGPEGSGTAVHKNQLGTGQTVQVVVEVVEVVNPDNNATGKVVRLVDLDLSWLSTPKYLKT